MNAVDDALRFVRRAVRGMDGYVPGLQPGPGQTLVKLNTNENPYPPSPRVLQALRDASEKAVRLYPSPDAAPLRERAAATYGVQASQVLCGNGSDEVLAILMRTFVGEGDAIAYFKPSYSLYPVLAGIARARTVTFPLPRVARPRDMAEIPVPSPRAKVFFLTTPNSPYGVGFPTEWIARLLERFKGIVAADEAYADFAEESSLPLLAAHPRLVIVRTLSKAYSLAGMRAGLALAHEGVIREMMKVKDSYNVSRLAQITACAAMEDREHFQRTREAILATRASFSAALAQEGFTVLPSSANFLFAVPPAGMPARALYEGLLARGFLVRHFTAPVVSDGLRISIGTDDDMEALARAIAEEIRLR
ncbi:MAG: histidinol-phosphate transaminase [Spirochaetia bacterium]|jgi:histidinol-phosphate aminotransferase